MVVQYFFRRSDASFYGPRGEPFPDPVYIFFRDGAQSTSSWVSRGIVVTELLNAAMRHESMDIRRTSQRNSKDPYIHCQWIDLKKPKTAKNLEVNVHSGQSDTDDLVVIGRAIYELARTREAEGDGQG